LAHIADAGSGYAGHTRRVLSALPRSLPSGLYATGHNRIAVRDRTKTSNVLVWISTLATTQGQSRTDISEITLQALRRESAGAKPALQIRLHLL
jgi:hypothetical protein